MARPRKHFVFPGMKHGHLTVLSELKPDKWSIRRYRCRCECGKTAVLRSNHFSQSRKHCSQSCKLLREVRTVDLTGQTHNYWRVIRRAGIQKRTGWTLWWCECKCGKRRRIPGAFLTTSNSRSCGCLLSDTLRAGRTDEEMARDKWLKQKEWRMANRAKTRATSLRYERKLSKATPDWLTDEHWAAMNRIYERARRKTARTGRQHDVDHIVPINGKNVSGLHVPWNMQILSHTANVRKSNRYADLSGD